MVDPAGLAMLVVAATASLFMAWTIGAGSSGSTPFAPAVGANAISVMRAGFVVGVLGLLGAIVQGENVSQAMGRELVAGASLSPVAAAVALLTAASLVAVGVFTGYPIATAFTATGAVVGTGLALGGAPAWAKYQEIASLWVAVPFAGGGAAYATARLLRSDLADRVAVAPLGFLVGAIVANVEFAFLSTGGGSVAVAAARATGTGTVGRVAATAVLGAAVAAAVYADVARAPERGQRHFLLALGGLVAFSAGGSQVGLAVGPLLPLLEDVPVTYVLAGGGVGLLVGSWTGAPRMIKTLSRDYSSLGPRRSIAALIPSFAIAQTAVFLGVPVSFNEIIVSAIVGSGVAASRGGGPKAVSGRKMAFTALAWVASLAVALLAGYGAYTALVALGVAG
ncbi:MAG: anion permease [Halobacteriaceae archaeon]